MKTAAITILGGGISGVTAGVVLQLSGYRTRICTSQRLDAPEGDPAVASHWAAASVIPHSVAVDDIAGHTRRTQCFFEVLRQSGGCGVRLQRHYEVFEAPASLPPYAEAMRGFRRLSESGESAPGVPRREGVEAVYGWHFDAYFADLPVYRPRLCALYEAAGGTIIEARLAREDLPDVPGDALVNCTGLGALALFDDSAPYRLLRGRLVHVEGVPPLVHPQTGRPFSYNYVPGPDIYRASDGTPGDVYCYPRADAVVLGGTREAGRLGADGVWQPEAAYEGPTHRLDGGGVPAPVLDLNRQLLQDLTGVDPRPHPKHAVAGSRFVRHPVRLEVEETAGRPVVHNYGHGGAGVALSWSCALEVARLIADEVGCRPPEPLVKTVLRERLCCLAEETHE